MANTVASASVVFCCFWILRVVYRWRRSNSVIDNLPGPLSPSFLMGNLNQFYNRAGMDFHREVALNYGPVVRMAGLLGRPILYVYDPKALHSIVIKDQHVYEEARVTIASNLMIFGPGLLSTLGDHHKKQRKMLNPVFSINHMRHMTPIFLRISRQLCAAIASEVRAAPCELDVLNWLGRLALELIGQGGLGYSFDPLTAEVKSEYGEAIKAAMPSLMDIQTLRMISPYVGRIGTAASRRRILDLIPHAKLQKMKNIVDIMSSNAAEIYAIKKQALQAGDEVTVQQIGEGRDIMSILMKANTEVSEEDKLPEHELIAQMTTLIFAAMDTTSNMLSRILQVLAQHLDVQGKLRQEILCISNGQDLSYEDLMGLPYLDAVIRETLRFYPPATILPREARKDMVLPLSEPIRGLDGNMIYEIPIPKNTDVIIGVLGSNFNRALWGADTLEWKPERWLSPLPAAVLEARIPGVYSNLMSFMGGGRACIGFKFSELEMKTALCALLPAFNFELPNGEIGWNIAGVDYPTMGGSPEPRMLLKVSALEKPTSV